MSGPIRLRYTNYRGEMSMRMVTPEKLWFGSTQKYPEPQWLLTAFDHMRQRSIDLALGDCNFVVNREHIT